MQLQIIQNKIHEIRGHKVMLDFDLAQLYETETKILKQAVKRNMNRFPSDFMFELTRQEYNSLRSQIVTLENKGKGKYSKFNPYAFTEQGVAMLSAILHSDKAIQVNITIMRTFVFIRQFALNHKDLTKQLKELEIKYNKQFKDVYEAINLLLADKESKTDFENRERIGFKKNKN